MMLDFSLAGQVYDEMSDEKHLNLSIIHHQVVFIKFDKFGKD